MKNQVIYLGIALMTFTSMVTNAKTQTDSAEGNQMEVDSFKIKGTGEKTFYVADEAAIMNPELSLSGNYSKAVEEVIAEDNVITERFVTDDLPVFKSKSTDEVITADNQIIEAVLPGVQPIVCNAMSEIRCSHVTAAE